MFTRKRWGQWEDSAVLTRSKSQSWSVAGEGFLSNSFRFQRSCCLLDFEDHHLVYQKKVCLKKGLKVSQLS